MICKQCGTESRELFCPRCGAPLLVGEQTAAMPQNPSDEPKQEPTPDAVRPEQKPTPQSEPKSEPKSEKETPPSKEKDGKKKKDQKDGGHKSVRLPPLRLSMVIWQALALLLPLAYLFFDAFVVYSDLLFLHSANGRMHLPLFIERMTSALYTGNSVGELAEATLGESAVLTQSVSLAAVMAGEELASTFLIPFVVLLLFVAICAVCAVFLILTSGRILRWRAFCNLTLFGGTGAALAPMIGMLIMAVSHTVTQGIAAADTMMLRFLPSFEYLCIMSILMCALLPAMTSIKKLAAYARRQNGFLTAPFGTLEKRPFVLKKVLAALSLFFLAFVLVGFFFLPVTKQGTLNVPNLIADGTACYRAVLTFKDALVAGIAPDHLSLANALLQAALPFATAVVLLCALLLLYDLCRILCMRSKKAIKKKGALRVLKHVEANARGAVLAPYICCVSLQVIVSVFLMIATPMSAHLNFSNVEETLSVLYLTIAYVRTVSGTGVMYAFMAVGGILLCYVLGRSADAMHLSKPGGKKKKRTDGQHGAQETESGKGEDQNEDHDRKKARTDA